MDIMLSDRVARLISLPILVDGSVEQSTNKVAYDFVSDALMDKLAVAYGCKTEDSDDEEAKGPQWVIPAGVPLTRLTAMEQVISMETLDMSRVTAEAPAGAIRRRAGAQTIARAADRPQAHRHGRRRSQSGSEPGHP